LAQADCAAPSDVGHFYIDGAAVPQGLANADENDDANGEGTGSHLAQAWQASEGRGADHAFPRHEAATGPPRRSSWGLRRLSGDAERHGDLPLGRKRPAIAEQMNGLQRGGVLDEWPPRDDKLVAELESGRPGARHRNQTGAADYQPAPNASGATQLSHAGDVAIAQETAGLYCAPDDFEGDSPSHTAQHREMRRANETMAAATMPAAQEPSATGAGLSPKPGDGHDTGHQPARLGTTAPNAHQDLGRAATPLAFPRSAPSFGHSQALTLPQPAQVDVAWSGAAASSQRDTASAAHEPGEPRPADVFDAAQHDSVMRLVRASGMIDPQSAPGGHHEPSARIASRAKALAAAPGVLLMRRDTAKGVTLRPDNAQ
jgi:hypothetical protein